ncbi:hypothetical protein BhaS171_00019 [Bacillus phage vB_BhaS-171]|uniref:hypothetical protein n=1 Tax=Bacillus phage vB_BhaS-171 TaxID=1775140 RepID=UPI0007449EE0|nr:hypothetical protein BH781_gp19 [Bacillus phage vB_BhaS-171]ALY08075.1 hypothetical protein BhaS171_00019 [Bacillus phage vB_BhaS-171]
MIKGWPLFNGFPLSHWGLVLQPGQKHPMAPELISRTLRIPGRPGVYDFGSDLGERSFDFPLAFNESSRVELQKRINVFKTLLFDGKGKPKEIILSFEEEPDKYYTVKYTGNLVPEKLFGTGFFILTLVAHDPGQYASQSYVPDSVDTNLHYDTGQLYESDVNVVYFGETPAYYYENAEEFEWKYARHYSGLYNHSHYDTPLVLEIEGTVINPRITNLRTGEKMFLPSIHNQRVTVDTSNFSVMIDDQYDLTKTSGDFLSLVSGDNHLLFEGGTPNAIVRYKWKHKFL